jgi:regulator of protease activity HflC (stomatin/prohibitin superfamily)
MKFTLKAVIIAIAVVIVIVLYGGLYTLEEGLQAVVVQFPAFWGTGNRGGAAHETALCAGGPAI